jgi:ubiquitin C-terminal hydrolase
MNITKHKGIHNIGNTCYMNSVIQGLFSINAFRNYLLDKNYTKYLYNNIKKKLNQNDIYDENIINKLQKYSLINALSELFEELNNNNNSTNPINPIIFKKVIGMHIPNFIGNTQEDGHEFLFQLLDHVHTEIVQCVNVNISSNTDKNIKQLINDKLKNNTNNTNNISVDAFAKWKELIENNYSIIPNLFSGLFCSEIKCNNCNYKSTIFEQYYTISLEIPEFQNNNNIDIYDCIEFMKQWEFIGDGMCEKCKTSGIMKKLYIYKLPKVLIIHFKRFRIINGRISKNNVFVNFPKENLMINNKYFDLCSIIKHNGNIGSGHYASCNKIDNNWFDCNDAYVKLSNPIINNGAYLLFYELKHL